MFGVNDVAALDIGSEKITLFYGNKSVNDTFNIKASSSIPYAGFAEGEWLDEESLSSIIKKAVEDVQAVSKNKIRKLFVGVPGEFTTCVVKEVEIRLDRRRRVVDSDIDELYDKGNTYKAHKRYATINCAAIYYVLDDNRRIIEPRGLATEKVKALVSYVLCERKFAKKINEIVQSIGIDEIEFVSSSWAEAMYLFEDDQRDKSVLLLDVGYITSSVMLARGDGLLYLSSFSCGGAHVTGDLTLGLDIPYSHAEQLKTRLDLNRNVSVDDKYQVVVKGQQYTYSAVEINEIAKARISFLADIVSKCLDICEYEYPAHMPLYITGGGLFGMRGAKELLSKSLNRSVEFVEPRDPKFAKPYFSSTLGLMDIAVKHTDAFEGFWKKIFRK
ncbi:MAG: hypothetical protein IJF76_00320 [Clostridia bacterium]|nr:hypothetical protein [Clostridia bacterium]